MASRCLRVIAKLSPTLIRKGRMTVRLIVLAVKPQRLHGVLEELKGALVKEQLVVSIVAGAKIETIAEQLLHASVVRTMPNTPAQIGEGVTAWTASSEVNEKQESQVCAMLEALGKTVRVENERQIDMATALSATGPTYIFLVMEALIDAGVHMGFSTARRGGSGASDDARIGVVCARVAQASGGTAKHGHVTGRHVGGSDLSDGERQLANGVVESCLGRVPARRIVGKIRSR